VIGIAGPWLEFEALGIKRFWNATDWVGLGWQDIHGLVEQRPIRVIAILAKNQSRVFAQN
jgi:hypothetical protein